MSQQSNLKLEQFSCHHLKPINLVLNEGEVISIFGESGSGKSLLLRAIADLIPYTGDVFLNGISSKQFVANNWRQQVSYFAAESQWWFDSVGEHFKLPLAKPLQAFLSELGFNEEVMNWEVMRCSTGEKQRLALIRVLANSPKVLLLDEPTSNLDADNTRKVEEILQVYQQQSSCSIVIVSHDSEQKKRLAQRQFKIDNSTLTEVTE